MRKKKINGPCGLGTEEERGSGKTTEITNVNSLGGKWMAHLHTVEASEQVVEDDHVAVDGEERQETRDGNQEEHASCRLQAGAAGSHEKLVRSCVRSVSANSLI